MIPTSSLESSSDTYGVWNGFLRWRPIVKFPTLRASKNLSNISINLDVSCASGPPVNWMALPTDSLKTCIIINTLFFLSSNYYLQFWSNLLLIFSIGLRKHWKLMKFQQSPPKFRCLYLKSLNFRSKSIFGPPKFRWPTLVKSIKIDKNSAWAPKFRWHSQKSQQSCLNLGGMFDFTLISPKFTSCHLNLGIILCLNLGGDSQNFVNFQCFLRHVLKIDNKLLQNCKK